jgi:site-specific DNA-methyltransferase (adenine-specific)
MPKSETINKDCVEYLKTCKDKQFSVLFTDPPYGSGINADWEKADTSRFGPMFKKYLGDLAVENNINHGQGGKLFNKYGDEAKHWDTAPSPEFWHEALRVADYMVLWGGNYFWLPPSRNFIIWEKPVAETFSLAQMEYCWLNIPGNAKIIKARSQDKFRFHPTQKPLATFLKPMEWYKKYFEPKGMIDPFMGSGTSRIAAWDMGIDYVGIELNKVYFDKQEDRFREHISKGSLYENKEIRVAESEEGLF